LERTFTGFARSAEGTEACAHSAFTHCAYFTCESRIRYEIRQCRAYAARSFTNNAWLIQRLGGEVFCRSAGGSANTLLDGGLNGVWNYRGSEAEDTLSHTAKAFDGASSDLRRNSA